MNRFTKLRLPDGVKDGWYYDSWTDTIHEYNMGRLVHIVSCSMLAVRGAEKLLDSAVVTMYDECLPLLQQLRKARN